ncbi:DNA cytosine methyltransferase [Flavobacterium ardleyense]|uniref:Cytosine-specific methyltransferase n=1 Tax=Flavobacterium ardleyense TaxID=2038737 RepID=A0ABW5Z7G8_9FLAO
MVKKEITVGSLYAGVGGICLGFKNSGFKLEWANEIDKNACITYRANFEHNLHEADIWALDPNELPKVDVLTAGFPCQPFSVAGYRKGFTDERGNHFFRIVDYINALGKPKVVFLENVKNLKGHDKGKTFRIIEEAMNANGYSFQAAVLNTKDFGNVPQNRERIYMVCFRDEEDGTNLYKDHFNFPEPIKLKKEISDILSSDKIDEKFYYREDKYMFPKLQEEMVNKNTIYQWRRQYTRENKSNVCPTLTANMGTGGHNVPLVLTNTGIRKLIPKECFLFQGYPENFVLPSTVSNAQLYKQAGNSVTVPVIERIAASIMNAINLGESEE